MQKKYHILMMMLGLFLMEYAQAQTVQWAVRPTSAQIENYGNLLKVRRAGKCGLMDLNNQEVIPVAYDSISPFRDGLAFVMNKVGKQLKLEGILTEGNNELLPIYENIYATRYLWFSEGKMPVRGDGGWGYLGTDGNMVIPCQFQIAYPFREGFASVMVNDKAYYINRNIEYMPVEVGYGNLVFASTFSGQEAIVYSGYSLTPKGYVINRQGQVLRKYKTKPDELKVNAYDHSVGDRALQYREHVQQLEQDSRYTVYQENGLYGYKKDGVVVLPAQLEKAEPVRGEYANVQYKSQNGVLHIVDGSFSVQLESGKIDVVGKNAERGYLQLNLPEALADASVSLRMKDSQGQEMLMQANNNQGEHRSFSFLPAQIPTTSGTVNYQLELWSENLLLWKGSENINYVVTKPAAPVSQQQQQTVVVKTDKPKKTEQKMSIAMFKITKLKAPKKAGANDIVDVAVTVKNDGDQRGRADVTLYVDGKQMGTKPLSVGAHGQNDAHFSVPDVKKPRVAKARAVLKDGKSSQEERIDLRPFY
ncbi:MAG: WG repeat-containing protein [Prevotella sp.]|nr:WG repeat-containing protein [Prevotella sp.]